MRTKALLCLAALAAGVVTSVAQNNVYSLNVVGYVNTAIAGGTPAKFTPVANPLNTTNNTLNGLINGAQVPFGCTLYKFVGGGYTSATFLGDSWDPNLTLNPGEGAFIYTDTAFTNTFVGEVLQGNLTNTFGAGFTFAASMVPQAGDLDALGLGAALGFGDTILKWNTAAQNFTAYTFLGGGAGGWDPSAPTVGVAESFFINSTAGGKWVRSFTVQ